MEEQDQVSIAIRANSEFNFTDILIAGTLVTAVLSLNTISHSMFTAL